MQIEYKKTRQVLFHILFWVALWLLYIFFFSYNSSDETYVYIFASILIPITIIPTYLMVYLLIPRYLYKQKYGWFIIYSFSIFLFTTLCTLLLLMLSIAYIDGLTIEQLPPMGKHYAFLTTLVYLIVAIMSFVRIWQKNTSMIIQNNQLQNQLLTTQIKAKEQELVFLKSQIHPHFLFNTLNTIYGLALQNAQETPDVILKLSSLLDYILYQVNKPLVPLFEEVNHLEQYIALEKIRFSDTLRVSFTRVAAQQSIMIAPLLLLPLVENAFKHGAIIDNYLTIKIDLMVTSTQLIFDIQNSYTQSPKQGGIGLSNIRERLQILYPNHHQLEVTAHNQLFKVHLKITY